MAPGTTVVVYGATVPAYVNKPWEKSKYHYENKLIKNNIEGQNKEEQVHKSSEQEEVDELNQSISHRFYRNDQPSEGPGKKLRDREK